jgi:RNA-binding protein
MLTDAQRRYLRGLAHARHPLVRVGAAGASEAVMAELDRTLAHHELVKIKVSTDDRLARRGVIERLGEHCNAEVVHVVGKTAVLFRRNVDAPRVELP